MNMTPRFKFEQLNEGDSVEFGFSTSSWTDVADRLYDFLLGCGFSLGRQDLADHFDQSVFSSVVDGVIEEHSDALDKLDDRPDQFAPERYTELDNHAERYGMQGPGEEASPAPPGTLAATPSSPRLLYEFTASDTYGKTLPEIWAVARRSVEAQQDYEMQVDGTMWPSYRVVMTGCTVNDSSDGLQYLFEVWSNYV